MSYLCLLVLRAYYVEEATQSKKHSN